MSKKFVVSCGYVDEKDQLLLEFLLTLVERQTGAACKLVEDMSGNIAIIDVDHPQGLNLYNSLLNKPGSPILLPLSNDTSKLSAELFLSKPLRSAEVVSVSQKILQKYSSPETTSATNVTAVSSNNTTESKPVPGITVKQASVKRLYNLLTTTDASHKPVEISHQGIMLYIDFSSQQFICEHKLMSLSMLFKSDINILNIREITTQEFTAQGQPSGELKELMLFSALLGSSGELSTAIAVDDKLSLTRWPDLSSIKTLPKHLTHSIMTIAGFMTKHRANISEIALQTQVKPEIVVGFINVCVALGYLKTGKSMAAEKSSIVHKDENKSGLFNKIRSRFGLSTNSKTEVYSA